MLKKHQILEADVMAHDDRIKDLNENANVLVEGGMFDSDSIRCAVLIRIVYCINYCNAISLILSIQFALTWLKLPNIALQFSDR